MYVQRLSVQQEAALMLLEQSVRVRDSASESYAEAVLYAHKVGCPNTVIAQTVGQSESAVRRWLSRRTTETDG